MKSFKLALYVLWIGCAVAIVGAAAAESSAHADAAVPLPFDPSAAEVKAESEKVDVAVRREVESPAEEPGDAGQYFGFSDITSSDWVPPALESDMMTPTTGWYKICVPNLCQQCWSDADCTPGNRCRAVYCP